MPDWAAVVLTAAGTGAAAVLTVVLTGLKGLADQWFADRRKRMQRAAHARGFAGVAEFAIVLDSLRRVEAVDRLLAFVGYNGGGLPAPGKPYTVRAYAGWSVKDGEDVARRYNFDLLVDATYVQMLQRLVEAGVVVNTTADMPDGLLKGLYQDEGVVQSLLYFLDCDGATLQFVSIASYRAAFTPTQRARIELLVARLRAIVSAP